MVSKPSRESGTAPPSSKKRQIKHSVSSSSSAGKATVGTVAKLEAELTSALAENASLNALLDLLDIVSTCTDADVVLKAIFALYRLFTLIVKKGVLHVGNGEEDADRRAVRAWIIARLDAFAHFLCKLLSDDEKIIRISSMQILFSLLRQVSSKAGEPSDPSSSATPLRFDVPFFRRIVRALLECPAPLRQPQTKISPLSSTGLDLDVRNYFLESMLNVYADIRWFFLRETAYLLENTSFVAEHCNAPVNALFILEKLTGMPSTPFEKISLKFWIEELNKKPPKKENQKVTSSIGESSEDEEDEDGVENVKEVEDDWRAFFEDSEKPADAKKGKDARGAELGRRLHTMSVHEQLHSSTAHRAVFTRCWLVLLPLLSFKAATKSGGHDSKDDEGRTALGKTRLELVSRTLTVLHGGVLPYLTRAVLIMDWISSCVDYGGSVGLLALNALFILIRDYNLDYPQFYTRLYAFLDRNVLHLRYRARFFRLTELFLSSTHLPATLLASFVKRLARLSLSAPPAAIIMLIPFTYNILKRHPALMVMIHRVEKEDMDAFNPLEPDPIQTGALQSSLWELTTHRQHYHNTVATLARILEEAFTRPGYLMEDFLDHTYTTLFETEVNRKIRKEPAVVDSVLESQMMIVKKRRRIGGSSEENDATNEDEDGCEVQGIEVTEPQGDIVSCLWTF